MESSDVLRRQYELRFCGIDLWWGQEANPTYNDCAPTHGRDGRAQKSFALLLAG